MAVDLVETVVVVDVVVPVGAVAAVAVPEAGAVLDLDGAGTAAPLSGRAGNSAVSALVTPIGSMVG